MIQIGEIVYEVLLNELIDERLSQPFDVHSRSRREVLEAAAKTGRARRGFAPPDHLLFVAMQPASAHLACVRHLPWLRVGRAELENRPDDRRNRVAGFF